MPLLLYVPALYGFVRQAGEQPQPGIFFGWYAIGLASAKFIHLTLYLIAAFLALRQHRILVRAYYSALVRKDLRWLNYLLYAYLVLLVLSVVIYGLALRVPGGFDFYTYLNLSLFSIFIYATTILGWRQSAVFNARELAVIEPEGPAQPPVAETGDRPRPRYEKSGLGEEQAQEIAAALRTYVAQQEHITDPDLSLTRMADALGYAPHQLSEVLGKHLRTSFYDLVNQQRVELVKARLTDPAYDHLTILAIAYECGFNAKSTFNTAFKKYTGQTPSAYKRLASV